MISKFKVFGVFLALVFSFGFVNYANATKDPNKENKENNKPKKQEIIRVTGNIKGIITAINGNSITIEVKENKIKSSKTVITDSKTRFGVKPVANKKVKGKKEKTKPTVLTISDFKVGDKVNVNGKVNTDGTITARMIKQTPVKNKNK